MLSLFRDLPWPIILKVLSLGIACKTLYVFYSQPSDTLSLTESPLAEPSLPDPSLAEPSLPDPSLAEPSLPDLNSTEHNSNEEKSSDLNSSEYNVLNMKINILYLELIKIQPQLEKIQTTLDSLIKSNDSFEQDNTHEPNEIKDTSNSKFMSQSVSEKDAEFGLIETHLNQTHHIEKTNALVEELSKECNVKETSDPIETINIEKETNETLIEQSNEGDFKETSVETPDVEKETNENHMDQSNVETPKSDKTCSFILRSGQRKGQSCNSKVKGRHTYCGMHR